MIAIAILFMGTFAILSLVSSLLSNARRLQQPMVDASALLGQLAITNQLAEGSYSGNLGDTLGKAYQDYNWSGVIVEEQSNKLFRATYQIQNARGNKEVVSRITTLFYSPQSPAGSLDGGNFIH